MNESFLQQLEQRTEQVKITLANLEAERVRIEGQIARLQPIVPHYDALLAAERSLADADITLHTATLAAPEPPGAGTSPRETPAAGTNNTQHPTPANNRRRNTLSPSTTKGTAGRRAQPGLHLDLDTPRIHLYNPSQSLTS